MSYIITTTEKLDRQTQKMVKDWIDKNLEGCVNSRSHGNGLLGNRSGQWRYRIGDYRLLAKIQDSKLVLIFIDIGHRRDVYKNN